MELDVARELLDPFDEDDWLDTDDTPEQDRWEGKLKDTGVGNRFGEGDCDGRDDAPIDSTSGFMMAG